MLDNLIDDGEGREMLDKGQPCPVGWHCGNCKKQCMVKVYPDQMRVFCSCFAIGIGAELHTYRKKAGVKGGFAPRKVA